jgi:3-keto-disaccharide hydrolase
MPNGRFNLRRWLGTLGFLVAFASLAWGQRPTSLPRAETVALVPMGANVLSQAEKTAGWRLLFDGKTLRGWRGLGYDSVPSAHWKVEQGAIVKIPSGNVAKMPDGQPAQGGDLMTVESFGDFELSWEWKVAPGANSGLKYNVSEEFSLTNASNHAALGFEYQILDDSLSDDNKVATHRAGALYDLIAPNERKRLQPVGAWNKSSLVFRGTHGEHWLNGEKIVEFDLGTPRMDSLLALSKYRSIKGFADRRVGHIILQDHGDEVWFRSIKIRVIGEGVPR